MRALFAKAKDSNISDAYLAARIEFDFPSKGRCFMGLNKILRKGTSVWYNLESTNIVFSTYLDYL